ncbi:MAG: hypothetical protein IPF96_21330 [Rhodobacter sp.]|nr:hypothetical protein [Rhodobacter sp.]
MTCAPSGIPAPIGYHPGYESHASVTQSYRCGTFAGFSGLRAGGDTRDGRGQRQADDLFCRPATTLDLAEAGRIEAEI